jgi:hypothetical protein
MRYKNRESVFEHMKRFDPGAKDSDFIEVTEWANGDGFDIAINDKNFSLTYDELDAINYLVMSLRYKDKQE